MRYVNIHTPPFPFFLLAGNAIYIPTDVHPCRKSGITCFDIIVIEKGTLHIAIGSEKYILKRGDAILISPNTPHQGIKGSGEKTLFHWLHFGADTKYENEVKPKLASTQKTQTVQVIDQQCDIVSIPVYQRLSDNDLKSVLECFEHLESISVTYTIQNSHLTTGTRNLFYQQELFMNILKIMSLTPKDSLNIDKSLGIFHHISTHYSEKIILADLAEVSNCHPTHLIRSIKKEYGITPMQMLNNYRLRKSCNLLRYTNDSITYISYSVGFTSPSYYCKQFKAAYGVSPASFRANISFGQSENKQF